MENNLEFKVSVLKHFKEIITEYNFDIAYGSQYILDELQLSNNKCIIKFLFDKVEVSCGFINPIEKLQRKSVMRNDRMPSGFPIYQIYSVWKFLYPNDNTNYYYPGWDIEGQVLAAKKLICERLSNVVNGDFSWANLYKVDDYRISKKIEYMMTHWEIDNPIRLKFNKGNPDWEKDFDEYKLFLDKLQL